ncbi:Transcriptional regulatory protein FixJ [Adhaeretor mobilis]|uniref:Transcriptional regulatory protein FixJ n=1 Tax=Adhaeretor mobilis TaxID=1930276 RepID=A0A517N1Y9_9BACT|nr:Transcriptional regulatory protein FixJ [Adhaeretor mobilis]
MRILKVSEQRGIIYVVDDDEQIRKGASVLLETLDADLVAFDSAESFLEAYDGRRPACLVTDLCMLGMSGTELQEHLHSLGIKMSVVVITAHASTASTVRAMKNGAFTLLEKPCDPNALWTAARNGLEIDKDTYEQELSCMSVRERLDSLTNKEQAVLECIVVGDANKVIARKMDVSIRTVENHRSRVFSKMKADSVAELVRMSLMVEQEGS